MVMTINYCLVLDTIPAHDVEYYTVRPIGKSLMGDWIVWDDMIAWCIKTYGPTPKDGVWTTGQRWYVNNTRFWFKDIADRDWFVLRWS
jgi:hypothetical protein